MRNKKYSAPLKPKNADCAMRIAAQGFPLLKIYFQLDWFVRITYRADGSKLWEANQQVSKIIS